MYVVLGFLIVGKMIAAVPRMLANKAGFWYDDRFTLRNVTLVRPERFSTKAHKAAFENVGRYITDALTRDVMISYLDRDLQRDNFLRPAGVPLEVWHQVLEFFADAGFIQRWWEMRLPAWDAEAPKGDWSDQTPGWLADGSRIKDLPQDNPIGGRVPGSAPFTPGLLTEEQKQALLGAQYAKTYTDCLDYSWHGGSHGKPGAQRYVTLGDEHFCRIYVRDRKNLSDEQRSDGAYKLAMALGVQAAAQK